MLKYTFLFSLLFSLVKGLNAKGFEIKATVKGVKDSTCQLAYYFGDKQYIKDSARADAKGNLIFKGEEELPGGIYMIVIPGKKYFEMIVDKEQNFSVETDSEDLINAMKVKGSKDNEVFYDYLKWISLRGKTMESLKKEMDAAKGDEAKLASLKTQQEAIDKEVKDYKKQYHYEVSGFVVEPNFKASMDPEVPPMPTKADGSKDSTFPYRYFRSHYFDNINMKDDRLLRTPVFAGKIKQYIERVTPQIPDSVCASATKMISLTNEKSDIFKYLVYYITNTYEKSNVMGMDAVFVCMAEQYYLSGKAYWVDSAQVSKIQERVNALKPCLIGKQAYNMRLLKPDFHPVSFNDIKSNYTIVYFWDPSCGHCQKVTPKLRDFYNANKTKLDVEVLGVYIETDTTEWFKYIKEKELNWINAADLTLKTNFRAYYDIYSTPVIYVLDRNKKIIAKRIDVENLEDFLKNYSKTKSKLMRQFNVLGGELDACCMSPMTGYYRDGHCNTSKEDTGSHTVCVKVSDEFLEYSKKVGNDLSTARPEYQFPGLKDGDQWCLCAARWLQACEAQKAPPVVLSSTNQRALEIIPLELFNGARS